MSQDRDQSRFGERAMRDPDELDRSRSLSPLQSRQNDVSQSGALSAADVLAVARRWWWQCMLSGLLIGAAAVAVVWLTFKPVYEASAWLEVKDRRPHVVFEDRNDSKAFAETQLQTIRSPVVLRRVSNLSEIANLREKHFNTTLQWLEKGLKANFLGRSELCQLSFRCYSPDSAMKVTNAILDAYLSLHQDTYGEQVERIVELLAQERDRRKAEVEELRERVRVLNKKAAGHEGALTSNPRELVVRENPLVGLEARRTEAEVERALLEAKLKAYEEAADPSKVKVADSELGKALQESVEIRSLRQRLAAVRANLAEHAKRSARTEKDPTRKRYEQEAAQLEQLLVEVADQLRPRLLEEMQRARAAEYSHMIVDLQADIKKQLLLEETWQKRIEECRSKLQTLGGDTLELEFARQELLRAEEVFDKIGDRLIVLRTERGAPPQALALQRAAKPEEPLEAVPYKKLGAAFFGGFFLPFGLAFVWERSLRRISDSRQLSSHGTPPLMGEITTLPARWMLSGKRADDRLMRDRITFEESIDSLCMALMLSHDFTGVRTLAVTSAVSREGKTSLASSLAISLARRSRQPTLLIDADLRAPDLHEIFDVPLEPGLVDVLEQGGALERAIVADAAQGIDLLPAGRLTITPHAILRYEEFLALLNTARTKYRYIVVDSPPVLAASEALMIASIADGALVCAMRDVSRTSQFELACRKLTCTGARLLGAVMSGIPTRTWAQKYGGYGYGWDRYLSRSSIDEQSGLASQPSRIAEEESDPIDNDSFSN